MNLPRSKPMRRIKQVHFVGIGGSGMCGIAEVVLNLGYQVSGSDLADSPTTRRLAELGAKVFVGHAPENVEHADVVVVSTAVTEDNPEVVQARANRIPIVHRAMMLAELMRFRHGIAVAGTHGKTTTTSLLASVMAAADQDPTFVIGGRLNAAGSNARLGQSHWLVAEADESDASFLDLLPMTAVITNIEPDHMDTYGGDFENLKQAFVRFVHNLPFYGVAVVCGDDPVIRSLLPELQRPILTYGFGEDCDIRATEVEPRGLSTRFTLTGPDGLNTQIEVGMPGRHNVLNALAVAGVALDLGLELDDIKVGLSQFSGVGRRFQSHGNLSTPKGTVALIDDYGHHPTEVQATLAAAREAFPEKSITLVFQPHRFTRTRDCFDDFVAVLEKADQLVLLDVYPAGESPIKAADSRALASALRQRGKLSPIVVSQYGEVAEVLNGVFEPNSVVITQGAGDVGKLPSLLTKRFGG